MDSSKIAKIAAAGVVALAGGWVLKQWPKSGGVVGLAVMAMLHELLTEPVAQLLDEMRPT